MVSPSMEDYLLAIYRLNREGGPAKTNDIAERVGVTPASVTEMLKKLSDAGMVDYERYRGTILTPRGHRHAHRMHRKHRLVEKFFVEVLDSDAESAHESACRIEHTFSDEAAEKLCSIIGSPEECEDICGVHRSRDGCVSVTDLDEGESARISHLNCDSPERVRKLISMGFVPGRIVRRENDMPLNGPMVVRLEDTLIVLDREYTSLVMVDREE